LVDVPLIRVFPLHHFEKGTATIHAAKNRSGLFAEPSFLLGKKRLRHYFWKQEWCRNGQEQSSVLRQSA
jgi:hypothetical protein